MFYESTRKQTWQGRGGAFGVGVGMLLLGFGLAQSVPPQGACPAGTAQQSLKQPRYRDTVEQDPGIGFMSPLVQSFLHTVQPNPFPQELILKLYHEFDQEMKSGVIKESLLYQVGFLVCAAIGVLYIVLMPIVGFFLACCRCCGNCGGKMEQKQTSYINCRRTVLYWCTFVTTAIILAGNICMFKSNEDLRVSVEQGTADVYKTIDNLQIFFTSVPRQIDYVVNESYKTVQDVRENLDGIGLQLGTEIQDRFRATLDPALRSIRVLDQDAKNTSVQLEKLNTSLAELQSSVDVVHGNATAIRNRINRTIYNPNCLGCLTLRPELQKLRLDISVRIPSLREFQSALEEVIKSDLQFKIKEVEDYFNSIPQRVTNDTKDVVESSKQQLEEIKTQISKVTSDIPLSALTDVLNSLNQARREVSRVTPEVERADYIRWAVGVAVCCIVLLVVACNAVGLLFGPVGLKPKCDPRERSCLADCGGTFFMMSAGFSFLFSWLLMIIVLLLFLLGGNLYTLICQPLSNGKLLKFLDTPGLIPDLDISKSLGGGSNITISGIYRDCEKNQPLWSTLRLYELINLEELLNVSKYTEEIHQLFDKTDITLSTLTFLNPEVQKQLRDVSSKAQNIDFSSVAQQMNKTSSINLNKTADKIEKIASTQANIAVRTELQNEARDVRQLQADIDTIISPQVEKLNSTFEDLRPHVDGINGTVGEVLTNVGAAQDFLNTNTTQIVKTESRKFLDCQLSYFVSYANWATMTITQQVGRCGPVAGAVDSAEIILCSHIVESLNAFWCSLGWCVIFFIPGVIFSIKLAKHYRRMKYSEVYDNGIAMNHIPRPQMKLS